MRKMLYAKLSTLVLYLLIFIDLFLFRESADARIFGIILIYITFATIFRLGSSIALKMAFVFLIISFGQFVYTDPKVFQNPGPVPPLAERTAVWVYLLLVIGVVQKWRER